MEWCTCFLNNTFYIFTPLISNLLTEKIYYLIIYLIITLFSMLGFIVLCFFIDEKFVTNNSRGISNDDNEVGQELNNINVSDNIKILKQLNSDKFETHLNTLNSADVAIISKILPKYLYFHQLTLGAFEPRPVQSAVPRTN